MSSVYAALLAFIAGCLIAPFANAQVPPVDFLVAIRYVEASHRSDWDTHLALTHPDAIVRYGQFADLYAKIAEMSSGKTDKEARENLNLVNAMFGTTDAATIRAMSGKDLLKALSQAASRMAGVSEIPAEIRTSLKVEYIGHVAEGTDFAHVVVRNSFLIGGEQIVLRDAVRLKRSGDRWLVDGTATGGLNDYLGQFLRAFTKHKGMRLN